MADTVTGWALIIASLLALAFVPWHLRNEQAERRKRRAIWADENRRTLAFIADVERRKNEWPS